MGVTRWTDEEHVMLLAAVLATSETRPNPTKVSEYLRRMGIDRTAKSLSHKFDALRKVGADSTGASPADGATKATPSKRKVSGAGAGSRSGNNKSTGFEGGDSESDADPLDVDTPTKKQKVKTMKGTGAGKANGVKVKVKKEKQKDKLAEGVKTEEDTKEEMDSEPGEFDGDGNGDDEV